MRYFDGCMTLEELKAKYKEWVLKLHPDRNPDNPNAAEEFKEMQEQYECREAELKGDYSKSRKNRERREREERERAERERKEREARKVEAAIEQARKNKNRSHNEWKAGEYVYARKVNTMSAFEWESLMADDLLHMVCKEGVQEETVVMIETIVELSDKDFFQVYLSGKLPDGVWGGYEVLQDADRSAGRLKGKRVAKLVMFRSPKYCIYGNPMGDQTIRDYYMTAGYETMFSQQIDHIRAIIEHEKQEKERIEAERRAKLLAEQAPLLLEWQDKLIELSRGLSAKERETVAVNNLKTMLKAKFPGTTFKVAADKYGGYYDIHWEDGPTTEEVFSVTALFDCNPTSRDNAGVTPWKERYGEVLRGIVVRKMSTLTKARILQQLGQVTAAFREGMMLDEVPLSDFDWLMLHAMAGIDLSTAEKKDQCRCAIHPDGHRSVTPKWAIDFVFQHTSYYKPRRTKAAKAA